MTTETNYDPRNLTPHTGKSYKIGNEIFSFNSSGRFYFEGQHPTNHVEGVIPEVIAGLDTRYKEKLQLIFGGQQRHGLVDLIEKCGEEPAVGKILVFALNKEDAKKRDRIGYYSAPLEEIA